MINGLLTIWDGAGRLPIRAGGLNAVERWEHAHTGLIRSADPGQWIWYLAAAALLLGGCLALVYIRRTLIERENQRRMLRRAAELHLSEEEFHLLNQLARLSHLRSPLMIFVIGESFETAVSRLEQSRSFHARPEPAKQRIYDVIAALREKLGFQPPSPLEDDSPSTLQIEPGVRILFRNRLTEQVLKAHVTTSTPTHLVVAIDQPFVEEFDEHWTVRYPHRAAVWEFHPEIVRRIDDSVLVRHSRSVRMVNRRHYPRAACSAPAFVAKYPFGHPLDADDLPVFVPCRLVELGGPGIRIRGKVDVEQGERLLVILKIRPDVSFQGMGVAGRVHPGQDEDDPNEFVVDLVGLQRQEMKMLLHETEAAQQAAMGRREDAPQAQRTI